MWIRYFCLVGPATDGSSWCDLGYRYLAALQRAGMRVRAVSIGAAFFNPSPTEVAWAHWARISDLFRAPLEGDYVNVVCCPPRVPLGQVVTRGALARTPAERELDGQGGIVVRDVGALRRLVEADAARVDGEEVAYRPSTALAALWTAGRRNVAITGTRPQPPESAELEALALYDRVLSPCRSETEALAALGASLGISATHVPPRALAGELAALVTPASHPSAPTEV